MEPTQNISDLEESLFKKKLPYYLEEFQFLNKIGQGSQGQVYEVSSEHFQDKMAMKSIKLPNNNSSAQIILKQIKSQIIINTQIQQSNSSLSKFFPQFHGYFVQNQTFHLIFQLCSFDLNQVFSKLKSQAQKYTFCWILLHDMIKALSLLEQNEVIHQDIKPQNILFKDNHFKLIDLGLGKQSLSSLSSSKINPYVGNIFSKAPEIYIGKHCTKSDIWALGITIYFLLEGKLPYDSETIQMMKEKDKIQDYIKRIKNKSFNLNLCLEKSSVKQEMNTFALHSVLENMLTISLEQRPFASEINQKFFSAIQFDQLKYQQIIKDIISIEKPENPTDLRTFLRYLILKYLEHRQSSLGLFYVIFYSCINEILHINTKILKINALLSTNSDKKNKKIKQEKQLLKNIKTSCFKLFQTLQKQMQKQSSQNSHFIQPITSFGEIQLSVEEQKKPVHQDHMKLQAFITVFLQKYDKQILQKDEKETIQLVEKSIVHKKVRQTQKNTEDILICISNSNIDPQILRANDHKRSKQTLKGQKRRQDLISKKTEQPKQPQSIKCLSKQQFKRETTNQELQIFMKFFQKEKLRERFPLLGEMGELLKKLVESSEDQEKRKVLITADFKLWRLSLDLSNI